MNERIVFPGVPAARILVIVRQYALKNGLRYYTDKQQQMALKLYCETASILN